jgi:hypothetical protein
MKTNQATVKTGNLTTAVEGYWQDTRVRTALQIVFLIGMGALSAFLKSTEPSLGISGSSAILWLGPIVLSRMLIARNGAGALVGVSVALWGIPIGINNGLMHNVILYGGAGLALDTITRIPFINIRSLFGAIFCGVFAHLVKFGVIMGYAAASPVTKHFEMLGIANSFGLHIVFGAAAGLAAWIAYRALKSGLSNRSSPAD